MVSIDASDLLRNLATIERRVLDAARVGIAEVARVAEASAKGTTLFKDRTTNLRTGIAVVDTGAYSKRLIAPADYAVYVNAKRPFMENAAAAGSQAMAVIMNDAAEHAVDYP